MQEREIANSRMPKMIITFPSSDDTIKIGSTYTIKWELENVDDVYKNNQVDISIRSQFFDEGCEQYGSIVSCPQDFYSIAKSIPNVGNFIWNVVSEIKPGRYKMEIVGVLNNTNSYSGISNDYFQIISQN